MQTGHINHKDPGILRIRIWYGVLLLLFAIFIVRLFYLQVIRHDHYQKAALTGQLKQYEIPAERGMIVAQNGDSTVPLVLNETRYTAYADPQFIKDKRAAAAEITRVIGGDQNEHLRNLEVEGSRYAILAKRLDKAQKEKIDEERKSESKRLENDKDPNYVWQWIGLQEEKVRTYPHGTLAAQLLGFVDNDGTGKYGIEQALDSELKGTAGQLKAITDAQGVPLAANKDNVNIAPKPGKQLVLTIDLAMQQQLEEALKTGLEAARSPSGTALIMDPNTGAIKAMANYPTYNPAEFGKVEDGNLFTNAAVAAPFEVGSIMKPLTVAAGMDMGAITKNSTYYDNRFFHIDDATVRNVEEDGGAGTKSMADILQLSLNTGVTWVLMQMGGGEINEKGRTAWHTYMTDHYKLGEITGVEQGYEADGLIPSPTEGYGLDIQYANSTFGQGMTATPLQMAAALSATINGGTYYRPRLIEKTIDSTGHESIKKPEVVRGGVVGEQVSKDLRGMMEAAYSKNRTVYGSKRAHNEYRIGGKTGTAQIPKAEGGYHDDKYNGTYIGYVGGDRPDYVIMVRVNEPKVPGYAGSRGAAPIFVRLTDILIDNFGVTPKD